MLQDIVYLRRSAHSWYWQVVSPLWEENSSPYFLIVQLLPVPWHVFLPFQDFLSPFDKGLGHYNFFQVEDNFPYVCHIQKPSSLLVTVMVSCSERPFLKLNPDYLLTSLYPPSYRVICTVWVGYSFFTLPLLMSTGRTTDVALSQMSLLSCWEELPVSETWPSDPHFWTHLTTTFSATKHLLVFSSFTGQSWGAYLHPKG